MESSVQDIADLSDDLRTGELYQRAPWDFGEGPNGFMGGWWSIRIVGELVTEIAIRLDGDQSLLRRYENVDFTGPVYAGDYLRFRGELTKVGHTSRTIGFVVEKVLREGREGWPSAEKLDPPQQVVSGRAVIVVGHRYEGQHQ